MLDAPQFATPSGSTVELKAREVELAETTIPTVFKVRAQLLEQGRSDTMLAATDDLTVRLRVYASGGENELHAHPTEDHAFIILQGAARFFGPDGEIMELGKNEGIMIPAGNLYRLNATSTEPLVLLRVGNPNFKKQKAPHRINANGEEMKGDTKENKSQKVIVRDGEFFG